MNVTASINRYMNRHTLYMSSLQFLLPRQQISTLIEGALCIGFGNKHFTK